jgi:hypothetical protein
MLDQPAATCRTRPSSLDTPGRRVGALGNAGLTEASPPPTWPVFRPLTVTRISRESSTVASVKLAGPGGAGVPPAGRHPWPRLPRGGPPVGVRPRGLGPARQRRSLYLRARCLHDICVRRPGRARCAARPHSHRVLRCRTRHKTRHRGRARPAAAPARRTAGQRPSGHVRAQRPERTLGSWLRQSARARRSLRRAGAVGMPHRGMPLVRDRLLSGTVSYAPDPVDDPADSSALICCSRPRDDLILDL